MGCKHEQLYRDKVLKSCSTVLVDTTQRLAF